MKTVKIITAKIEPDIYKRIEQGTKHYEMRDAWFDGDVIRYVDTKTGKALGIWKLEGRETVEPIRANDGTVASVRKLGVWEVEEQRQKVAVLADIDINELKRLFPDSRSVHLRRIGRKLPDDFDGLMEALDDEQA